MKKIIVLVGISGSGKSTYAHQLWSTNPSLYTIINRDKIRELLFGYTEGSVTEYYSRDDLGKREKEVTKIQDTLINEALEAGKTPIMDATHLSSKYILAYKYWNVKIEVVELFVTLETAMERIKGRERKISEDVVQKQLAQYMGLSKELVLLDLESVALNNDYNPDKPSCVCVDLDGTLAEKGLRSPYAWHMVDQDTVIDSVANCVRDLYDAGTKIVICTGRDGVCTEMTQKWLEDNSIPYHGFFIRKEGDMRPDWVVKEEMWRKIKQVYNIDYLIDDRLQVVRRARALGLKVFNVEHNNF